ncbi:MULTISPECIES: nuclear transport factor 2 family protein [Olivibacter]|uniref:Nuclear transport factor 2 family protein n=1 Tax=Olivibacter jilunii TaxID=985016 RepID=A0ABW6BAK4_9SPHI|nr:nuclear transport factor 2 family protein [Pseudosphingobacterium sp.]
MKKLTWFFGTLCILFLSFCYSLGNAKIERETVSYPKDEILALSKKKWKWIIDRQIDSLQVLFDENIVSRQPEIRMDKAGHLDVIKNGNIRYKQISVLETDIQIIDNISTLLTKVEFNFPGRKRAEIKYVTEVFKKSGDDWKLILFQINPI